MKNLSFIITLLLSLLIASCGSVYKKHYENGYTFIKHKKKVNEVVVLKKQDSQQKSIAQINESIQKEKKIEQKKAEETYQTYHKAIERIKNNGPAQLLSNINKFSLNKIESFKTDTLFRKDPNANGSMNKAIEKKAQTALIISIVSVVSFFFLFILSLIPAILTLSLVKKVNEMAKLNGEAPPSNANVAKIIAWVTIGLNLLFLLLILLYVIFILLIIASI